MSLPKCCAIYTRKSSEEGLEQDFNSLAAQREACAAYIASQAGEGWVASGDLYDDGGYSGGTLERPALQRLLADIEAGGVDIVVVYKVDRLTRALTDFAKIVERFDSKGVSFVSVTQAFNTTSSMGRLTLNVLLSFAQFEREVTGERIRDKIAASKQKGMWMGGMPPLGYAPNGRSLAIVPEEAETIRRIYARYLALQSVPLLVAELKRDGVRSKPWTTRDGRTMGGCVLCIGAVRHILKNRLYLGEIPHKDKSYPGLHEPIIAKETFEAVQAQLKSNAGDRRGDKPSRDRPPLLRLLFDEAGRPMRSAATWKKGGVSFRYYVSPPDGQTQRRVPAILLEKLVAESCARVLGIACEWSGLRQHVVRVALGANELGIDLAIPEKDLDHSHARLREGERLAQTGDHWKFLVPLRIRRWRGGTQAFDAQGSPVRSQAPDPALLKGLVRAFEWREEVLTGLSPGYAAIAQREGVSPTYVRRVCRMAYLAPDIIRSILAGSSPAALSMERFMRIDLPRDWVAQRRMYGAVGS